MAVSPAQLPKTIDDVVDTKDFNLRVIDLYERGVGDIELEVNLDSARAIIPAATGELRDFSFIAPEIPEFIAENCVGCMDCAASSVSGSNAATVAASRSGTPSSVAACRVPFGSSSFAPAATTKTALSTTLANTNNEST